MLQTNKMDRKVESLIREIRFLKERVEKLEDAKKEETERPKTEKEILRERCDELGIKYIKRDGVKELKEKLGE
jgi:hypothetical protein